MRRFVTLFLLLLLSGELSGQASDAEVRQEVAELLRQMTLEEKVGQMTQVTLQTIIGKKGTTQDTHTTIDIGKLRQAIATYHVGSLLNVYETSISVSNWHTLINQIDSVVQADSRLKIPIIYGIDAIHGANYVNEATIFPQNINMAATWNPELVEKSAAITAAEIRACGLPWNFNPVLGLARTPLWPRVFETFGEDPHAASVFAKAYVHGTEGPDQLNSSRHAAACMKHYIGYSFPLNGRDRTPAWIPERQLRELFVPPFQAAIDAGVHTVMINSTEINGIPVHASHFLLTKLLREEMGFRGFVVSDWRDIKNLHVRSRIAASHKEAVRLAVMAGIDMSMVPKDYSFFEHLLALAQEGAVPIERIDQAVSDILFVKYKLGLFTSAKPPSEDVIEVGSAASRLISLKAAHESIVLAKNENAQLPLKEGKNVLVTGPTADGLRFLNSGWTYTWQGDQEPLYPQDRETILAAIRAAAGKATVTYVAGSSYDQVLDIEAAVRVAANVDEIVLCLGENPYCETPGNITDLALPPAQLQLAEALLATGKPVTVIMVGGRPRLFSQIADRANAVLIAMLPGNEGGQAIADILYGRVNPSAKLPLTYPRHPHLLTPYDRKTSVDSSGTPGYDVLYPFGHGLSYTSYAYRDLLVKTDGDRVTVDVTVENTGKRDGQEVVMLFVRDNYRSVTAPVRQLKGFQKVAIKSGAYRQVTFQLSKDDLSFIGLDLQRIFEAGTFTVTIDDQQATFSLE
jgi:beta-glucosidase